MARDISWTNLFAGVFLINFITTTNLNAIQLIYYCALLFNRKSHYIETQLNNLSCLFECEMLI